MFPCNGTSQILYHSGTQAFLSAYLFASIHLKLRHISIYTISSHPHFQSSFGWLHRHVLLHRSSALIFYHALINAQLTVRFIQREKFFRQVIYNRSYFTEPVIIIATWTRECIIVYVKSCWL